LRRAADLLHTNDGAAPERRVAMTASRHWSAWQAGTAARRRSNMADSLPAAE